MDERQAQIREGAGLEESRLNVEFIDLLRRWSTPVLVVIAAAAVAWAGLQYLNRARLAAVDRAFRDLESARLSGSPEALVSVAQEHDDVRAVGLLARLDAADAYLAAVRAGLKPGSPVGPDGSIAEEDVLTEEDRSEFLRRAEELYRHVEQAAGADPARAQYLAGALFGLAAVAECRGQVDQAREYYQRAGEVAASAGLEPFDRIAQERVAELAMAVRPVELPEAQRLPPLPWVRDSAEGPEEPAPDDVGPQPEPAPDQATDESADDASTPPDSDSDPGEEPAPTDPSP